MEWISLPHQAVHIDQRLQEVGPVVEVLRLADADLPHFSQFLALSPFEFRDAEFQLSDAVRQRFVALAVVLVRMPLMSQELKPARCPMTTPGGIGTIASMVGCPFLEMVNENGGMEGFPPPPGCLPGPLFQRFER